MKKIVLTIVIGTLFLFMGSVNSEAQLNFGVKSLSFQTGAIPMSQSLGSYFGANIGQNAVVFGGVDYGRLGLSVEVGGIEELDSFEEDFSFSSITPHAGVKLYLRPRGEGDVSPYFFGALAKSIASVDLGVLGQAGIGKAAKDAIEDLLSPFGFYGGFGSEYYFSDSFGIGGEVGIRALFSSTEASVEGMKAKLSINQYTIYSGFTFNFVL
jgi:hypothetical protein